VWRQIADGGGGGRGALHSASWTPSGLASAAKIGKAFTPRFMRRTFQDLGRAASVHYSSVSGDEVRTGSAKVIAQGRHR
jgi:hypothetical protein